MKLPENTLIAKEKLTNYLLVFKKRNDKSMWLAKAGYTVDNWQMLERDLRVQILSLDAKLSETTMYGQSYEIVGQLTGPNKTSIWVQTIWMIETATGVTKFITLYPSKRLIK